MEAFIAPELGNFICEKPHERYPELVKMFYTNGIINSEVGKHLIVISLEDFTLVYNMSFMEQDYDQMDLKGNKFNFDSLAHSLLIDQTSTIPSSFNVVIIHPNIRLIHYTTSCVMFPRKANYSTLSKSDIRVVLFLENRVPKNWADVVLHHIIDRKRKKCILPYAELITKNLHHSGYPFPRRRTYLYTYKDRATCYKKNGICNPRRICPATT